MEEFKINKITVRTGEFSGLLSIDLKAEVGDIEMDISKVLDKNKPNDYELIRAIESYATNEVKNVVLTQKKHSP